MRCFLQNGKQVKLIYLVFSRETYDALCMLAAFCPNMTFETDASEKVKLYQISLVWRDICSLNPSR